MFARYIGIDYSGAQTPTCSLKGLRYFEVHALEPDWLKFLDDFRAHWPTDKDYVYVEFVRDGNLPCDL